MIKNFWLKQRANRQLFDDALVVHGNDRAIRWNKTANQLHKINTKFLGEAKRCAIRWGKSGLLKSPGQALLNEQPFNVKVRTKNSGYKHGFSNKAELHQFLDMLCTSKKIVFACQENQEPSDDETIVTVYHNQEIVMPS